MEKPSVKIIDFQTTIGLTNLIFGSTGEQDIQFTFMTPDGIGYRTTIGPIMSAQIFSQLRSSLESLPDPYAIHPTIPEILGTHVPGKSKHDNATVTYFGQAYDPELLQALGVLMVRVNLFENNMVHLLSVVAPMPLIQAEAAWASITNMKSKRDLIMALLPNSGLSKNKREQITIALDEAKAVSDRRNTLYHAQWSFKNDKFEIQRYQPNAAKPRSSNVETKKSILQLATDFRDVAITVEGISAHIRTARIMALNASANPVAGSPSSSEKPNSA